MIIWELDVQSNEHERSMNLIFDNARSNIRQRVLTDQYPIRIEDLAQPWLLYFY